MYGIDIDVARKFELNHQYAINTHIAFKETIFETTTLPAQMDLDQKQSLITHRWKIISGIERQLLISGINKTSISLQGIAGPQPIPVDFLPRTWDYVHNLYPFPELGTMFGTGLYFKSALSHNTSIGSHLGFFGGYLGGDLLYNWKSITLSLATWGIETTSAYHILGERFWQASVGFSF